MISMTNQEMLWIAMNQSAEDMGCQPEDFLKENQVMVPFRLGEHARKYLKEPITCNLVTYGNNVVAAATGEVADLVSEYISRYEFYHCFETPNMHWLNDRLMERGHKVCFMAEYYLPDVSRIPDLSCTYETRLLDQKDFTELYLPESGMGQCAVQRQKTVGCIGSRCV